MNFTLWLNTKFSYPTIAEKSFFLEDLFADIMSVRNRSEARSRKCIWLGKFISCYKGGVTKPITSRTKWIGRSLLLPALVVKMASSNAKEIKTMKLCKFSSILGKISGQPYTIVKKLFSQWQCIILVILFSIQELNA